MRTAIYLILAGVIITTLSALILVAGVYRTRYEQTMLNQAQLECVAWGAGGVIIDGEIYCEKIYLGTSMRISLGELKGGK